MKEREDHTHNVNMVDSNKWSKMNSEVEISVVEEASVEIEPDLEVR